MKKKSAKFWAPHPSGLHPSGPTFSRFGASTLWAPTLRGSTLLGLRGSTLRGPIFRGPTFSLAPKFNIQKLAEVELAEVEIGRSRNWPKSKLAEVELAELEKKSWPKSITPNAAWASNRGSEHVDVLLNDSLPLDSCSIEWQRRDWSGVHSSFWSIHCPPSTLQSRC